MSPFALEVPAEFGWSFLVWGVGTTMFVTFAGGPVMAARKKFEVPYPNLYATPGFHKHADEFNSIQRGAMNMFETIHNFQLMALFGSLYSSNAAMLNTVGGICYIVGTYLYAQGYATNEKNGGGRYKKGGMVKWLGGIFGLVTSTMMSLKVAGVIG